MFSRVGFGPKLLLLLSLLTALISVEIPSGYIFNGTVYTPCEPGTYQLGVVCEPCPPGYKCPSIAMTQPIKCAELSQYSDIGSLECTNCSNTEYSIDGSNVIETSSLTFDGQPVDISDIYQTECYINKTGCSELLTNYLSVFDYARAYAFIPESDFFTKALTRLHIAIPKNDTETIRLIGDELFENIASGVIDFTSASLIYTVYYTQQNCFVQLKTLSSQLSSDSNFALSAVAGTLGSPDTVNILSEKAKYDEYLATHGYLMTQQKSVATNSLALDYLLGKNGRIADMDKAEDLFKQTAQAGNPESAAYLGYISAVKGKKDEACNYYRKASNNGVTLGMLGYAECLVTAGRTEEAINILLSIDNLSQNPAATDLLASIYHGSYGQQYIDKELEVRYLKLSASAGNVIASFKVANMLASDDCHLAHNYFALVMSSMSVSANQKFVISNKTYDYGILRAAFMGSLTAMRRLAKRNIPGAMPLVDFLLTIRGTEPALRYLYQIDNTKEHMILAARAGSQEARFDACWKYADCDYNDPVIKVMKVFRLNYKSIGICAFIFVGLSAISFSLQTLFTPFKDVELTPNYEIPARFRDVINDDVNSDDDDPELRAALARSMEEF